MLSQASYTVQWIVCIGYVHAHMFRIQCTELCLLWQSTMTSLLWVQYCPYPMGLEYAHWVMFLIDEVFTALQSSLLIHMGCRLTPSVPLSIKKLEYQFTVLQDARSDLT